mgnify:CR=1 FL=1
MVKLGTRPNVTVSAFSRLVKEKSLTGICSSRSDAPPWESVLRTRESVLLASGELRYLANCAERESGCPCERMNRVHWFALVRLPLGFGKGIRR